MDRLVAHDPGPKCNAVTPQTECMAGQAEAVLRDHLGFAGTDFYGETGLRIEWSGGQIKRIWPRVEQSVTPD